MILLDTENYSILHMLRKKAIPNDGGKYESVDINVTDDDGIRYHIASSEDKAKIFIDVFISFRNDFKSIDISEHLAKVYGPLLITPPPAGVDARLLFDSTVAEDEREKNAMNIAMFRKNLYGAILNYFFSAQSSGKSSDRVHIKIREGELITIEGKPDRVTVAFTLSFSDSNDVTIGRVFLNEFKESRKASQSAPQVLVSLKDPPTELSGLNVPTGPNVGYVSFVLTTLQIKEQNRDKTVVAIHNFLPYLKYHMKCSKAYLHSRMRAKTEDFIKILNRARPEPKTVEKKTFSGKTFQKA